MKDQIKMNNAVFLRLMELAREEICNDADLHDIAEIATRISQEKTITMSDYQLILDYKNHQNVAADCDKEDELESIKRLGGLE